MKPLYLILPLSLCVLASVWFLKDVEVSDGPLRVSFVNPWNTIHPGLQHTLVGDLVLSNQFDALVGVNDVGVSVPLGAQNWQVSEDFKRYRFSIDPKKSFQDGSPLTAADFKRSWETAAQLTPLSANNSLSDVLYKIEGFADLKTSGEISGIKVVDDLTLEINFSSPFRMALEHLQGSRFAAFKETSDGFVGTGIYTIKSISPEHALMIPRAGIDAEELDVTYVPLNEAIDQLLEKKIDVIYYLGGHNTSVKRLVREDIGLLTGESAMHLALALNRNKARLFEKREYRQALLYLVWASLKTNLTHTKSPLPEAPFFDKDSQFYLPFQAGRLEETEVKGFLKEGEKYASSFIKATRSSPIKLIATENLAYVVDYLEGLGLSVSSKFVSISESMKLAYASDGPDISVVGFSVASGDPDGLYHKLGKNGAIRTPYVYSPRVEDLLEEGRNIIDISKLDTFYKEVSRELFRDVPMIHLGFARALTAYRKDRVQVNSKVLRRNQGHLHFLQKRE